MLVPYDLRVKKAMKAAGTDGPVAMRIQGPFLTIEEIGALTALVVFAATIALAASLLTGNQASGTAILADGFSASLIFSGLAYVRLRFTQSDDWAGLFILGMLITVIMALASICTAILT